MPVSYILYAWNDLLMCARNRFPSPLCFAHPWMAQLQKCLYKAYSVPHWALWWICTLFMMSVNVFYLVAFCCFTDMLHEPFGIYQYEFSVWISRVCTCHNALGLQIQWPDPERSLNDFCKNQHLSTCYIKQNLENCFCKKTSNSPKILIIQIQQIIII